MTSRMLGPLHLDTVEPANPVGAPVLCLHGLFAGAWVFDELLPMIAARGHSASALSFRGHPPTPPTPDMGRHSLTAYSHDAAEAARVLDRPIVIGHSMGGLVALMLAARGVARAAIIVSSAPPRGIPVLSGALLARMGRYLPAMLFSRPFLPTPEDLDALVLNRVPVASRAALRDRFVPDSGRVARQIVLGRHAVPRLSLRAPLLVMGSDDDRFVPLRVARKLAERYGAPLHVARGHGHFLFAEPGWRAHAAVMLDWMDALPRVIRDASPRTSRPNRRGA